MGHRWQACEKRLGLVGAVPHVWQWTWFQRPHLPCPHRQKFGSKTYIYYYYYYSVGKLPTLTGLSEKRDLVFTVGERSWAHENLKSRFKTTFYVRMPLNSFSNVKWSALKVANSSSDKKRRQTLWRGTCSKARCVKSERTWCKLFERSSPQQWGECTRATLFPQRCWVLDGRG